MHLINAWNMEHIIDKLPKLLANTLPKKIGFIELIILIN